MQVIPATFQRFADKDWDINNPDHNIRAGLRYIKALAPIAGDDPRLIAAGYYGGEGAIPLAQRGQALRDPRNPSAPDTLQYGEQVASRIPAQTAGGWRDAPIVTEQPAPQARAQPQQQQRPAPRNLSTNPLANIYGALNETMLQAGSGMIAKPVAEVAGLAALAKEAMFGGGGDPKGFRDEVQNRLTYSPRTMAGAAVAESPFNPLNIVGNVVGGAANLVGNLVGGNQSGDTLQGMLGNAAREAVPQGLGLLGAKRPDLITRPILYPVNKAIDAAAYIKNHVRPGPGYIMNQAAGGAGSAEAARVMAALDNAQSPVPGRPMTVGEASLPANSPPMAALQARVAELSPDIYSPVYGVPAAQTAAERALLSRVAGGPTATASLDAQGLVREGMRKTIVPQQQAEIAAANRGLTPIDVNTLKSRLSGILDDTAIAGDKTAEAAVRIVNAEIEKWAAKNGGVPDAAALHSIRTNGVRSAVERVMPGANESQLKARTAGLISRMNPAIDEAIMAAGGTGWKDVLAKWQKGYRGIDRMKMGSELMQKYDKNPQAVVDAARGNATDLVESVFGPRKYDIAEQMGGKMGAVNRTADAIDLRSRTAQQAKAGADLMNERIGAPKTLPPPGAFKPMISAARSLINRSIGTGIEKGLEKLGPIMAENPQFAAQLMRDATPQQRAILVGILANSTLKAGAAFIPSSPQNALIGVLQQGQQ
jgi:hypothetical protein